MGRAEVQPSVNVLMRADPIVHYTIAFTVTGHELHDEDDWAGQYHSINPPTHTRNAELHEQRSCQSVQMLSKRTNLSQPGIPLCREHGKTAVSRQLPYYGIWISLEKSRYGRVIPGSGCSG
jgi:hypothetical protein